MTRKMQVLCPWEKQVTETSVCHDFGSWLPRIPPTNTKLEILAAYFTCLKILKNLSMQQANPSMKSHKYEQEELKVYWKKHKI